MTDATHEANRVGVKYLPSGQFGVPTGTIRTWTSQKRLPSDRVYGRVARYRLAHVLEGLEVRPAIPGSRRLVLDNRGALTDEAGKAS